MSRSIAVLFAVVAWIGAGSAGLHPETLSGQEATATSPTEAPAVVPPSADQPGGETVDAADPAAEDDEDLGLDLSKPISLGVTPAGIQRHVSGRWATLAVNGINRTEKDTEETSVVMIGDDTGLQFARRVWVPAGARRQAWLPIRIPGDLYPDQSQIAMTSIHLKSGPDGENFQANAVGMPTSTRALLLSWEDSRTAISLESINPDLEATKRSEVITKTIYAGRDATVPGTQDLGMAQFNGEFLPPTANPLDSLDQMVIADDSLLTDTVGVNRLRAWLQSGGRVWIMADQVSPESVRALLGDAVCYSIVDRVQLNDYQFERVTEPQSSSAATEDWSSETPVEMVRVLIDTDDVQCRVEGWPAAFWMQVGHGEVLFTTLEAPGWLQGDAPTDALRAVSARFFVKRLDPPRHTQSLAQYLTNEIGYQIPGRGLVTALLGTHLLAVVAAGIFLARRKELHYLGIVLPVVGLVAAVALAAIGKRQTTAVPSTIATGQIVKASADSSNVQVESVAAIYSQDARQLPITSSAEAMTHLERDDASGEARRILWDDSGRSQWMFVEQRPSKVQHVETDSIVTLSSPWSVRGRFTTRGLEGTLTGLDPSVGRDPVIVSAAYPSLSVVLDPATGNFVSGFDQVLLPDQFFDASLISDVQQRRQLLMRELFEGDASLLSRQPALWLWTDPVEAGAKFGDGYTQRGWSLASIPIRLEPLEPGADFRVPASFVSLRSPIGSAGASTVFSPDTGRWLDSMNKPSESTLQCIVPSVLIPCELTNCRIEMKVSAPGRIVEVRGWIGGEFQTLHRVESPAGTIEFEFDNPDALRLDDEGGFPIMISVSETEQEREAQQASPKQGASAASRANVSRSTWAIDYVHVNLEGTTL